MFITFLNLPGRSRAFVSISLLACLCLMPVSAVAEDSGVAGLSKSEVMRLGELMYRQGVLPSGEPIKAYVSNDVPVDGTVFSCDSCHLHSGLGSIEGEVITPPTNGRILYEPREPFIKGSEFVPSYSNYAKYLPIRPAYTDETLATLIAAGIDPIGRSVLEVMPRYDIAGRDMEIMIAYLKMLSDEPPPGVTKEHINFATVIVEGTDPVKVASMLASIQNSVDQKNSLSIAAQNNDRVARMGYNMLGDLTFVTFSLDQWTLSGPPETWRDQLEKYYAEQPVYALLAGISEGDWEPVHRFCEDHQIPNLFPVVDYPVISDTDWYTQYLSRGVLQEGEAAARYLSTMADLFSGRKIVQIVRDNRRNRTLAEGFRTIWNSRGNQPAVEIRLATDQTFTGLDMQQMIAEHKPAALLFWDEASQLYPTLAGLVGLKAAPSIVITSGTTLGDDIQSVPEELRKMLYMTYPYRLPQDDARFDIAANSVLAGKQKSGYDPVVLRKAYVSQKVLGMAMMEMRGEYYQDFLLDMIGMMEDQYLPLYQRLSFGPGQRYASKGCFIVQLGKGENPVLERRSEWVIQ